MPQLPTRYQDINSGVRHPLNIEQVHRAQVAVGRAEDPVAEESGSESPEEVKDCIVVNLHPASTGGFILAADSAGGQCHANKCIFKTRHSAPASKN